MSMPALARCFFTLSTRPMRTMFVSVTISARCPWSSSRTSRAPSPNTILGETKFHTSASSFHERFRTFDPVSAWKLGWHAPDAVHQLLGRLGIPQDFRQVAFQLEFASHQPLDRVQLSFYGLAPGSERTAH